MTETATKLIVGLGNPGKKYAWTRHNIGFEVLDAFASQCGFDFKEAKFTAEIAHKDLTIRYKKTRKVKVPQTVQAEPASDTDVKTVENKIIYAKQSITETFTKEAKIICALPQTFMNSSGDAVQPLAGYYKIPLENILVVHDDVSLDTGKLRMAFDRGAGGQHGIEDIIEKFGGKKNFHRLKFGVGPDPGGDARNHYVLAKFPKDQNDLLQEGIVEALKLIYAWLLEEDHQQISDVRVL